MTFLNSLIQSIFNQDLLITLTLQTIILFIFPHLIFLIRNFQKRKIPFITLALMPIIVLLAVLIFFPIKLGGVVSFDFSTLFLIIVFALFGDIVSIVSLLIAIAFVTIRVLAIVREPSHLIALIPYLVSLLLVIIGNKVIQKFSKKIFYIYVFSGIIINSISVFLTSVLIDPTTPNLIMAALILFVIVPSFGMIIFAVLDHNKNFLIKHEDVINQEILHKSLLSSAYNIQILAVDLDFNYLSFNIEHERVLDDLFKTKPLLGENILTGITIARERNRMENNLSRAFNGEVFIDEIELEGRKGLFFKETYAPIKDENEKIVGATIFITELSERVEREKRIQYLSYHDQGTGLYNRRYYEDYIQELSEYQEPLCFVYADINGLKITNDLFGHDAGDDLLIAVTSKLTNEFNNEMIARIGGDEIIIIVKTGELKEIETIIKRIQNDLQKTIVANLLVSVSFGVARAENGSKILAAQQEAEDRMYSDKLNSVNTQHKDVVEVLLKKINNDYELVEMNQEIYDLALAIGKDIGMTNVSLDLLKEVVNLQVISCIFTPDRCPYIGREVSEEESSKLRKRLMVINRLILTTEIYNPVSFDFVSIFENYDGSGQPRGLQGKVIPLKARLVRIVVDYVNIKWRDKLAPKAILTMIEPKVNHLYDPTFFDVLKKIVSAK